MMMSPESYKERLAEKTLEELVVERNELISSMNKFENRKIINKSNEILPEDIMKPSASTIYYTNNLYLKEITDLIVVKLKERKIS